MMNLREAIRAKRGSKTVPQFAAELKISYVYLWELENYPDSNPSKKMLDKLGLRKVVKYEPLPPVSGATEVSAY